MTSRASASRWTHQEWWSSTPHHKDDRQSYGSTTTTLLWRWNVRSLMGNADDWDSDRVGTIRTQTDGKGLMRSRRESLLRKHLAMRGARCWCELRIGCW